MAEYRFVCCYHCSLAASIRNGEMVAVDGRCGSKPVFEFFEGGLDRFKRVDGRARKGLQNVLGCLPHIGADIQYEWGGGGRWEAFQIDKPVDAMGHVAMLCPKNAEIGEELMEHGWLLLYDLGKDG